MRTWLVIAATVLGVLQTSACGGAPVNATCGIQGEAAHPEIGGELLFYCWDRPQVNGGIYLLDVSTGKVRALTSDLAWNLDGAWSPDGTQIAFQSTREGRDDIFVMDATGGSIRRLTDGRGFNEYPDWSPDGRWISFNSSRDGVVDPEGSGYYRDIYLMRRDGSHVHRLTDGSGPLGGAAWNPSGDSLAFAAEHGGTWDVFIGQADGGAIEQATHFGSAGGGANYPRWSPDGGRLLFQGSAFAGAPTFIYDMIPGQDTAHQLTFAAPGSQGDSFADWSPDGEWIAFVRTINGVTQLYAMRRNGSQITPLTAGPGNKMLPRWRPA